MYGSVWHGSLCAYYVLLSLIRGIIIGSERRHYREDEAVRAVHHRRIFRITGVLLFLMNAALFAPVSLMVLRQKPVSLGLIPAITMAAYTTYKVTLAAVNFKRRNRSDHLLVRELRTINFLDALLSVLTLQNTLLMVTEKSGTDQSLLFLSASTSAAVLLAMLILTAVMLIKERRSR